MDKHTVLNVNFPAILQELIKGIKICRQAYAKYEEDFIERNDPNGTSLLLAYRRVRKFRQRNRH